MAIIENVRRRIAAGLLNRVGSDDLLAVLAAKYPGFVRGALGSQALDLIAGGGEYAGGISYGGNYSTPRGQASAMLRAPTVYKCVRFISTATAATPWHVMQDIPGQEVGQKLGVEHPLTRLLKKPNPYQSEYEFKEALVGFLQMAGNSFIYCAGAGENSPIPLELWPIRPDRMEIVPDDKNFIKGYIFRAGATELFFTPQEIIHLKRWHPLNDYWGLTAIQVLGLMLDVDHGARNHLNDFYKNQARLAGVFTTDSMLTEGDQTLLKKIWARDYVGAGNAWKVAFLFGGLKYEQLGVSQADMQIIETMGLTKEDIYEAYDIPLGIVSENATEANAKVGLEMFAGQALYPQLMALGQKLTSELAWRFGEDLSITFDDVRPVDKEHQLAEFNAVKSGILTEQGYQPGMTRDEIRQRYWQLGPYVEQVRAEGGLDAMQLDIQPQRPSKVVNLDDGDDDNRSPQERAIRSLYGQPRLPRLTAGVPSPWGVLDEDQTKELNQWRRMALNRVRRGEPLREFETEVLPALLADVVRAGLAAATDAEEVKAAFAAPFRAAEHAVYP